MEARFRQVLQRQERHGLAVSILLTLRALTTLGWVVTSTLDPPLLNNPFRSLLRGGGLFRHIGLSVAFWPSVSPDRSLGVYLVNLATFSNLIKKNCHVSYISVLISIT